RGGTAPGAFARVLAPRPLARGPPRASRRAPRRPAPAGRHSSSAGSWLRGSPAPRSRRHRLSRRMPPMCRSRQGPLWPRSCPGVWRRRSPKRGGRSASRWRGATRRAGTRWTRSWSGGMVRRVPAACVCQAQRLRRVPECLPGMPVEGEHDDQAHRGVSPDGLRGDGHQGREGRDAAKTHAESESG
ncbi:unnamed protein product, partial [Prorocentrum cordatum]